LHFDSQGGNVVTESRTGELRFVLFGAGEGTGEEVTTRALVLVFLLEAELAGGF